MVGYILVYPQNITSIDAESGASCDTTALKSPLSGGDLMEAYQTPSGHLVRAPWAAALPSYILPLVGVGGADRSSPLSAMDATSILARPLSAMDVRTYSPVALDRAPGLVRTANAGKKHRIANRTIFSPPFHHKHVYILSMS